MFVSMCTFALMVLAHHTFVFVAKRRIKCKMKFCIYYYIHIEARKYIAYKIIERFYLCAKIGLYTTHAIYV